MILHGTPLTFSQKVWESTKFIVPTIISCIALWVALKDRRPKLVLKARKGNWYATRQVFSARGRETRVSGVIEVYNSSSRANAVQSYSVAYKKPDGTWEEMESQRYEDTPEEGQEAVIYNDTPLTVAPYSGVAWRVMGIVMLEQFVRELTVRITVVDLFGKGSTLEIVAS